MKTYYVVICVNQENGELDILNDELFASPDLAKEAIDIEKEIDKEHELHYRYHKRTVYLYDEI
jgi:hypothetical protein